MHPRITELLEHLERERAGLRDAVAGVPSDRLTESPGDGRWSAVATLEHLALVEKRVTGILAKRIDEARAAGLGAETESASLMETFNLSHVRDRSTRLTAPQAIQPGAIADVNAAWAELGAARESLRALLHDVDGLALGEVMHPHPVFGPLNVYQWFAFIGSHEARHADQIREIGAALTGAAGAGDRSPGASAPSPG